MIREALCQNRKISYNALHRCTQRRAYAVSQAVHNESYEEKERKKNSEEYIDTALYYTRLYAQIIMQVQSRDTRRASSHHQIKSIEEKSRDMLNQDNEITRYNLCIYAQTSVDHLNCQRIIKETLRRVRIEFGNRLYYCLVQHFENIL